jgi:hypothetical protein
MKTQFKNPINNLALIFLMLATMFVLGFGCNTSKPAPDPLAGFHFSSLNNLNSNKAITDDYQNYIQNLPPQGKKVTGPVLFFEDGTGQHGISVEVFIGGTTSWTYIFIYDKEDKRTQAIKYRYNKYQS